MEIVDVVDKLPRHPEKEYKVRSVSVLRYAAVHHSLTKDLEGDEDIYAFARYHVNHHGWPGLGYNYVIDTNGIIYKTNYLTTWCYHVGNYNRVSVGICLVGDFRDSNPTSQQRESLYKLLTHLRETYNVDIKGHSEFPGYEYKSCPAIDMDEVRAAVEKRLKVSSSSDTDIKVETDAKGKGQETPVEEKSSGLNLVSIIKKLLKILFKRS